MKANQYLISKNTVSVAGPKDMPEAEMMKVIDAIEEIDLAEILKNHLNNRGINTKNLEITADDN